MAKTGPKKMREWHSQLLDWLIANPRATLTDTASQFDVSTSWISIVKNSDAFQAAYATRRADITSEVCSTVRERTEAMVETSLDVMTTRIQDARHNIPLDKVQDALSLGAEMLGITHRTAPAQAPSTQVNIGLVDPEALAEARRRHHARLENEEQSPQLKLINESIEHGQPATILSSTK